MAIHLNDTKQHFTVQPTQATQRVVSSSSRYLFLTAELLAEITPMNNILKSVRESSRDMKAADDYYWVPLLEM